MVVVFGRVVKGVSSELSRNSLQITAPPLTSSVILGKFFHLFEPQFSHLQNGYGNAYFTGLM